MSARSRAVGLLDVNMLIALAWPNHVAHRLARTWFEESAAQGWATTPITESGFVRVSSNRHALPTSTTPALARQVLDSLRALKGHRFWPDTVEAVTGDHLDLSRLTGHRQVTDAHLVALCVAQGGRLVTLDRGTKDLVDDQRVIEVVAD